MDINQLLKQISLSDLTNENKKAIKVKKVFVETIQVSGTNDSAGNCIITTNNNDFITPATTGFTPNNWYNDRWYFRATTNSVNIDAYYIDGDYNEGIVSLVCAADAYVQIPFPVRFVNKIIKTSGNIGGTCVCSYEPIAIFPTGLNLIIHQLSAHRSFYSMYMVPKNRTIKMVSIDYYRNTSVTTVNLLKYPKYDGSNAVSPNVVFSITIRTGSHSQDVYSSNRIKEGEVIVWYNTNTTSTSNTIDSTFELTRI